MPSTFSHLVKGTGTKKYISNFHFHNLFVVGFSRKILFINHNNCYICQNSTAIPCHRIFQEKQKRLLKLKLFHSIAEHCRGRRQATKASQKNIKHKLL